MLIVFFDVSIDFMSGLILEYFEIVEKIGRLIVKCMKEYIINDV